jgi:tight adherence protein C
MALFLAVVLLGSAIVLLSRALVTDDQPTGVHRSIAALEQLSPGVSLELEEEVEAPFTDRVLAPLHARALAVGRRITGADKAERIRHKLDLAGNPRDWTVDRVVGMKVLAAVILPIAAAAYGVVLGLALTTLAIMVLAGVAVGFFAPDLYLYQCAAKRSDLIRRTLADAVDLLTISVEAGLGFDAAVQQVARNTEGPLAEEFSRVIREMQLGMGRAEAMRALSDRTNVDELKTFVGAMVQADAFGIPIGQVLRVQSSEMRVKRRQHAEMKAQQVPVKIMVPLVLLILPCLFIVIMGPAAITAIHEFSKT